ncbi:LANO_0G09560g1_1 [Lachancea nothofagi CBS 11611]|uniref:LANO_0G09560g1_1 n=1 Tax=Lachancea nothofagi CBS 11611 TaxID=1266666 RepID=A0A1G4KIJ6_9SACH|nr:LANO_0G09560g1_1 [Lachancea nothofagi CBS 11611]
MFLSSHSRSLMVRACRFGISKLRLVRAYSTPKRQPKKDELPSFTKIAVVGVLGTIVFVEAVKSLDKNKPKNSYSESEFESAMQGVRRRKVMFQPGQVYVQLATAGVPLDVLKTSNPELKVVNSSDAVEHYRQTKDDKYYALLNELQEAHGDKYQEHLPQGLKVMLVGRYLQEQCHDGDQVVVAGFPLSVKDAIKFENEVCVVEKVLFSKSDVESDLARYFQTVNKVEVL